MLPIKNIPDIFDCNLREDCQILIIFVRNTLVRTGRQTIIQCPSSPKVCLCTIWEKRNQRNIALLSKAVILPNQLITHKNIFCQHYCHFG